MEYNAWNGKKVTFKNWNYVEKWDHLWDVFYQGEFYIFKGIYIYWALLKLQLQELSPNQGVNSLSQAKCCPDFHHK